VPNHIANELTAPKYVLDSLKSAESELDFETIVPMPEVLKGSPHSGITQWAEIAMGIINLKSLSQSTPDPVAAFERQDWGAASKRLQQANAIRQMQEGPYPIDWSNEDFEALLQCMRGLKEYGHTSWYDWSNANWGTKWNAYEVSRIDDTTIRFQTAWSAPLPWLKKLVEKFPNEEITIRWADEDFGNNVGTVTVRADGSIEDGRLPNDSPEAHRLAMELIYNNVVPEYRQQQPDGRYTYVED